MKVGLRRGCGGVCLAAGWRHEHPSFNDLLTDVREELAKRYLARSTISAGEVAHLVGFSGPQALLQSLHAGGPA